MPFGQISKSPNTAPVQHTGKTSKELIYLHQCFSGSTKIIFRDSSNTVPNQALEVYIENPLLGNYIRTITVSCIYL